MSADAAEQVVTTLPKYSIVLPAFNECTNIANMAERLLRAGEALDGSFEIIFVNDGSTDGTEEVLDTLAATDGRIRVVHFSRNFGHMAALTAGLEEARATGAVICMDADGQHPPELVGALVERWKAGADIVQTIRLATAGETLFKKVTSRAFYALMNHLSDLNLPEGAADFRLMDREVVDALNALPERNRFLRGLVHWIGFRTEKLPYEAPPRMSGTTKYSARKMLSFALSGITAFSTRPLRLTLLAGTLVLIFTGLYAAYVLAAYFLGMPLVPGWPSLLMATLMLSGIQLIMLGVASEYVGRILMEVKQRPIYIRKRSRRGLKR